MEHTWKIINMKRHPVTGLITSIDCNIETAFYSTHTPSANPPTLGAWFNIRQTLQLQITGSSEDSSFIPYDDLTEDNVLSWIHNLVDVGAIETQNSSSMAARVKLSKIPVEMDGIPWDNNTLALNVNDVDNAEN